MSMTHVHRLVWEWGMRCFGRPHMVSLPIRALRCAEEAVELAQACGVPKDQMQRLIEVVYSRPVGDLNQEIGGTLIGISVLCTLRGVDPDKLLVNEVSRVLEKPVEHFTKRNQDKLDMGLTAIGKGPAG